MTHNPAAAHPQLMALLDAMEKIEQGATEGPLEVARYEHGGGRVYKETPAGREMVADYYGDGPNREYGLLSWNALPPLLADLRTRTEEAQRIARTHYTLAEECVGSVGKREHRRIADEYATAHHACCTTALAAAAGTPALAVLAGELQKEMEVM